jgi:hypothetical protein
MAELGLKAQIFQGGNNGLYHLHILAPDAQGLMGLAGIYGPLFDLGQLIEAGAHSFFAARTIDVGIEDVLFHGVEVER